LSIVRSVYVADPSVTAGVFIAGSLNLASDVPLMPLQLQDGFSATGDAGSLSVDDVQPIFDAALDRLESAGAPASAVLALVDLSIRVEDLKGNLLAKSLPGSIVLDIDAAGIGWFLDPTPEADEEFAEGGFPGDDLNSLGRIDLLTVILHELGHQFGGQDVNDDLEHFLAEKLAPGQRRIPGEDDLDALFSDAGLLESVLE
jgi:hypothetical protein